MNCALKYLRWGMAERSPVELTPQPWANVGLSKRGLTGMFPAPVAEVD